MNNENIKPNIDNLSATSKQALNYGDKQDLIDWLTLSFTPRVGSITLNKLIHSFGTAKAVLEQDSATLEQIINNKTVAKLISQKHSINLVEEALSWLEKTPSGHILTYNHSAYPLSLKNISDPPLVLFLKGNVNLLNNNKFAIVGTRHPTRQGVENAVKFGHELSDYGLTIVSGAASGIDRFAHIGALKGIGSTIGVIGTGIDVIYPKSNTDLHNSIIEHGLLVSEFPLNTPPLVANFPRRNRIVAGLSLGCLVVESAIDGGSLITANLAAEMGREVMAIPGSIHSPVSRGCHKLIKNGAKLIENTNDILEDLQLSPIAIKSTAITNPILDIMGYEPIDIDTICNNLGSNFAEICAKLLDLELDGHIVNCGNGRYQRIFR